MKIKIAFLLVLSLTCISSCNLGTKKNTSNQPAEDTLSTNTEKTTHKSSDPRVNAADIIWRTYKNEREDEFGSRIDVSMDWPESGLRQKQLEALQTIILENLLGIEYKGMKPQVAVDFKVNSMVADGYLSDYIYNSVTGSYSIIEDFISYHFDIDSSNGGSMKNPSLQNSFDLLLDAETGEIVSLDFLKKKYNLSELSLDTIIKNTLTTNGYSSDEIDFRKARYKNVTGFYISGDTICLILPFDILWNYDGNPYSVPSTAVWNDQGVIVNIPWEDFKKLKDE